MNPALVCDEARALGLEMDLLKLYGPPREEESVVDYIRERALAAGVKKEQITTDSAHKRTPIRGSVGNLIVRLPGTSRGPRRLLVAHMDTVLPAVGSQPVLKGDRVVDKRGSCLGADDRAGVGAILYALETLLLEKLPHPPVTFLFTVQEEIGLFGARFLAKGALGNPKMGFSYDGGNPGLLVTGAPSHIQMDIRIKGIGSHAGAHPENGVSALVAASKAIADLAENGWTGPVHKGRQRATSNIGIADGGEATNIVMADLILMGEARSHSESFLSRVVDAHRKAFDKAARSTKNAEGNHAWVTFAAERAYTAFELKDGHQAVQTAKTALHSVGLESKTFVGFGGLDANWLNHHGIPTVTMGSGEHNPHSNDEYLDLKEFYKGCETATALAAGVI